MSVEAKKLLRIKVLKVTSILKLSSTIELFNTQINAIINIYRSADYNLSANCKQYTAVSKR